MSIITNRDVSENIKTRMAKGVDPGETAHYFIMIYTVCTGYLVWSEGLKRLKRIIELSMHASLVITKSVIE